MLKVLRILVIFTLVSGLLIAWQPAEAQATKRVWSGNLQGWYFYAFGGAATPSFMYGPGTPPLGTGSFGVSANIPTSGGVGIGRGDFVGTPLNALSAQYHTRYSATSGDTWRMQFYINTMGNPSAANCDIQYVFAGGPADTWLHKVPTAASGGWGGGWVVGNDGLSSIISGGLDCDTPNWGSPVSWNAVKTAFPNAVIAPHSGTTIRLQIYNFSTTNLNGVIDAVTVNGTTWDFEVDGPPAEFFDPGDGRCDPRPGDRLAIYYEGNRILVYGVNNLSRGFLLASFDIKALQEAGEEGIYIDKGVDGTIAASIDDQGHVWVAWTGGQYNASGRPEHGFAKLCKVPLIR
ncbi:MAG: hypothetical protein CUN50_02915 [Candidatus Thermofonsia Clade 1 bacterium]|uniref:Uncharacterized protein n=3 Tax=Candidatus Thermofonsia Clade 1 bacterium TaxID=2364210 RepID=A0A2M8PYZ5_9CHLR|nr:MAG: hypothetical protein CUN50_02915 [Candidatus Thermofonsia Clade 1 bacterium]